MATESFDTTALVTAAQNGSLDAFNALVLAYQSQVYNLARYILRDDAAADDATQEAFISAYHALGDFRGGSFRAWLMRIVTNACYDQLRLHRRRPAVAWNDFEDLDEESNPHLVDHAELPEESVQRRELSGLLDRAISNLPQDQRTVLVLIDRLEYSYEEVAATLNMPIGTVKSRLARARARMRKALLAEQELLPIRYHHMATETGYSSKASAGGVWLVP
ncbi:MAG TPA: sigma-70 family RNA polymerase sigma factor [Anaerolineae bacterium]|nr:sigma-70 family RNA polymerase sigma factor [Anaerolineae bacterium]HQK13613.1 sigma-70 family RNA polymerase sigma factor [Anaerolineae bacterium]